MSSPSTPAPLGWIPQHEGGDEVGPSQHFTFPVDNSAETGPNSLTSFSSTFHVEEPDSDEEPQLDHIPRPPNSFMLYRKQVCKDFARVGPRKRRTGLPPAVPGHISKRAGIMWKALPAEERKVWDDLAVWHKEEHARKYPGYVYKPVRRSAFARRSRSRHPLAGRSTAASSSQATLTSTPRSSTGTPVPDSPISVSSSISIRSPDIAQTPLRRALHRRSLSVPNSFPNHHHLPPAIVDEEPLQFSERTLRRRSRSITVMNGDGRSYFSDYPSTSDFMNFEEAFINYPEEPSALYNESSSCATPGVVPYHAASPLATVASNLSVGTSSLAGWNGESMLAPRPQAYTPQIAETFYDQAFLPNPVWNSQQYGVEFYGSMEALDVNALLQYDIGLNEQAVNPPPSYLPFGLYPQDHEAHSA